MHAIASVVAGDASARTTTSTGNTIATEHLHLMMSMLAQNLLASAMLHVAGTICY